MKPAPFNYHRPSSIAQAAGLLASLGDDAVLIAGGQSLAPMMNLRVAQPSDLIDLHDIAELKGIHEHDAHIEIAAMTTHHELATDAAVARRCPLLAMAAGTIGHYAIRKQGTLGGSLAQADPAAQLPLVAVALDAQIRSVGSKGARRLSAREFFEGVMTTALDSAEVLVAVEFPTRVDGDGHAYTHFNQRQGDYAIVAVAIALRLVEGAIAGMHMALGGVAGTPVLVNEDVCDLVGRAPDAGLARELAGATRDAVVPLDSPGVSSVYRSELVEALVMRAFESAARRASANTPGTP